MEKIVFNSKFVEQLELYQLGMLSKLISDYQNGDTFRSEQFRNACGKLSPKKYYGTIKKFISLGILTKKIVYAGSEWNIIWDEISGEDEI